MMPFGRGWHGWGGRGGGWGWGNPYPFCRTYPWLPRGWWRPWGAGFYPRAYQGAAPVSGVAPDPGWASREQETAFLRKHAKAVREELDKIKARVKEIEEKKQD